MIPQKKILNGQSVAAAGVVNTLVDVSNGDELRVAAALAAAGAAGDIICEARAVDPDGIVIDQPLPLRSSDSVVAALISGTARVLCVYDVSGLEQVEVRCKNNNVAAKLITTSVWVSEDDH